MSTPFLFELNMVSEETSLPLESLLRQPASIAIRLLDNSYRYIHGLIRSARQLHRDLNYTTYQADLVPNLWFLKLINDCRIFQKKTAPEIIEQVFAGAGLTDYRLQLYSTYRKREYCVQYRESDFNFVSRLMEEEGIFYFFEHSKEKHTLVLSDSPAGIKPCPGQSSSRFEFQPTPSTEEDIVHNWEREQNFRSGKFSLTDYDFEKPSTNLAVSVSGADDYEVYDYPGIYTVKPDGEHYAKVRLEEEESHLHRVEGRSTCRSFLPGYKFDLTDHYRRDTNQSYLLLSVKHEAGGNNYRSDFTEFSYENTFKVMPSKVPFRAPFRARRPYIRGSQTALVVGKKGEEIWVDKYGRIKVQFYWDRLGKKDENSSCWIRVSHPWAGKNWGAVWLPRMGQEVIVGFLEGDPDQPIITGRVYNAEQMHPWELPANQTQSGIKSRSTKQGGTDNFNEIRFEDKKGDELITIHAEKDLDESVENDRTLEVDRDQIEWVKRNKHLTVDGSRASSVGSDALTVGGDSQTKIGKNDLIEAGQEIHLKAGMKVIIEAGVQISLVGPGGFVDIGPAGVTIQGTMVLINSGGAAGVGTPANPDTPVKPNPSEQP